MTSFFLRLLLLTALLGLTACTHTITDQEKAELEKHTAAFAKLADSKAYQVSEHAYLGAKSLPLGEDSPLLKENVSMRSRGNLKAICEVLGQLLPVAVSVVEDTESLAEGDLEQGEEEILPPSSGTEDLENLLGYLPDREAAEGKILSIRYEGPIKGLLDQIALQSGYGWDFDECANSVTFAHMLAKTFTVTATPGSVRCETRVTNRSKEPTSKTATSSGKISGTVSNSNADAQTTQTATSSLSYDTWKDLLQEVSILLSPKGKAMGNQSAGTITVHDHPNNLKKVAKLISEANTRYSRQVALKVNVYTVDISDIGDSGIDISGLFYRAGSKVALTAGGALSLIPGADGTASATIVKGDLLGSQAVLKALRKWGKATQITSGGLVVRNNVPAPLQAIRKVAYLAGISSATTNYSQTTEVTPGEVSTGFSLTILPHILDERRVVLNCNISISYLEELKSFTTGTASVQLPQTSSRSFGQSATMQVGQTLVLAGWQQTAESTSHELGFLKGSRNADESKSMLLITISVENATLGG